jgi:hypothetical protein
MAEENQALEVLNRALNFTLDRIEALEDGAARKLRPGAKEFAASIQPVDGRSGSGVLNFIAEIDAAVQMEVCAEEELLAYAAVKCQGIFMQWWRRNYKVSMKWSAIKRLILNDYFNPIYLESLKNQEVMRFQSPAESFREFIFAVESRAKAMNLLEGAITELQLVTIIMSHINPQTFAYLRYGSSPTTIDELLKMAADVDGAVLRQVQYTNQQAASTPHLSAGIVHPTSSAATQQRGKSPPMCRQCGIVGHASQQCTGQR